MGSNPAVPTRKTSSEAVSSTRRTGLLIVCQPFVSELRRPTRHSTGSHGTTRTSSPSRRLLHVHPQPSPDSTADALAAWAAGPSRCPDRTAPESTPREVVRAPKAVQGAARRHLRPKLDDAVEPVELRTASSIRIGRPGATADNGRGVDEMVDSPPDGTPGGDAVLSGGERWRTAEERPRYPARTSRTSCKPRMVGRLLTQRTHAQGWRLTLIP